MDSTDQVKVKFDSHVNSHENSKLNLSEVRSKSENQTNLLKEELRKIETNICDIQRVDFVSYESIVSVTRDLKRLLEEIKTLFTVGHLLVSLKDYLSRKIQIPKEKMAHRSERMNGLKQRMMLWEENATLNSDQMNSVLLEIECSIEDTKRRLDEQNQFFFAGTVKIGEKKVIRDTHNKEMMSLNAEMIDAEKFKENLKTELKEAWVAATNQADEIDRQHTSTSTILQVHEDQYNLMKEIEEKCKLYQTQYSIKRDELQESRSELDRLQDVLQDLTEQEAVLMMEATDTNDMFHEERAAALQKIADLEKREKEIGRGADSVTEEADGFATENKRLVSEISSIEGEYAIWKKGQEENHDGQDSEEEAELDSEIEEMRKNLASLKEVEPCEASKITAPTDDVSVDLAGSQPVDEQPKSEQESATESVAENVENIKPPSPGPANRAELECPQPGSSSKKNAVLFKSKTKDSFDSSIFSAYLESVASRESTAPDTMASQDNISSQQRKSLRKVSAHCRHVDEDDNGLELSQEEVKPAKQRRRAGKSSRA